MKKIKLIINADDFGLTRSVCDSIISAHQNGVLTSATLLAGEEHAGYAAGLAARNPRLSVGIHFQLVAGRPVTADISRIKSLVDENGMFPKNFISFFKRLHTGSIDKNHIKIELTNQVKKAVSMGIKLTHADSHQHIHMHPWVLSIVAEVMREAGISRIRNPVEVFDYKLHRPFRASAGNIIKIIYMNPLYKKWFQYKLASYKISYPEIFFGQFFSGAMTCVNMMKFLDRARALAAKCRQGEVACEIMTHPGNADEYNNIESCDADFKKYLWREEYLALTSVEIREKIKEQQLVLCGYDSL
ncbi:MAG TPA: ChbG/HpnK family deacetylase [Candidatus Wallbacteria bacterium]|nr:ChbG/HpnK family deacetylase [Candidatus Wallbacteria bacterium]